MVIADALSRSPTDMDSASNENGDQQLWSINEAAHSFTHCPSRSESTEDWEEDSTVYAESILAALPVTDKKQAEIREESAKECLMLRLRDAIMSGWLEERKKCHPDLLTFWNYRDELTIANGLILKKIMIPDNLREYMLNNIHTGHLGIDKCKNRARMSIFWPNMNKDIQEKIGNCKICLEFRPEQPPEPLRPHPIPTRPREKVGVDLCLIGKQNWLVIADYYSNFIDVYELNQQTSTVIVKAMRRCFSREGVPCEVFSDNGPCFDSSEIGAFAKD